MPVQCPIPLKDVKSAISERRHSTVFVAVLRGVCSESGLQFARSAQGEGLFHDSSRIGQLSSAHPDVTGGLLRQILMNLSGFL